VLTAIDAAATRLSLRKLRPRRASLCLIERVEDYRQGARLTRLNRGAMPKKIPGVQGAGPRCARTFDNAGSISIEHHILNTFFHLPS